ncbi:putative Late nodulin [Medicago truncatula]|uniref:Putative Late nodulin n=1 Tax=Medicago truncatula TaxID=3880 RepID=A0A396GSM6_MEDTR|nr:putative Late nodulin [Medicago truncatula]
MAGIFNLVCAMVLFLSLFIVLTNVHGKCNTDDNCPDYMCSGPKVGKCIYNICYCINR